MIESAMARKVWEEGLEPQFSDSALRHLLRGLEGDDPRILQGATTSPPLLQCVQDWEVEACCGVSYIGWQSEGLVTVNEVESWFARACFECDRMMDRMMGESAICRWWLNWFDDTPRAEMRRQLAGQIRAGLEKRKQGEAVQK